MPKARTAFWLKPSLATWTVPGLMTLLSASENELRELLCEIGRRAWQREYIAANDGNFSVRLDENEILCTPTMVSKGFMKPHELPVITPDGKHLRGPLPATSEIRMHLHIYRQRPDVKAVVHVHPPHATAFAVAREPIPKCILPEVELFLGEIPIAQYETPGTWEFAATLDPFLQHYNAFLLANHGAVTCGSDPLQAYYRMESVEQYCRILLLAAQVGGWQRIEPEQVRKLWKIREDILGTPDRRKALPPSQFCTSGVPGEQDLTGMDRSEVVHEVVRRVLERLAQ